MRTALTLIAASGALLARSECTDRTELIRVHDDGSVTYEVVISDTSSADLHNGTPLPSAALGWAISSDPEGKSMTATRSFEARDSLPPNFADPDDPFAHRYVQFPTTITVDERDHGTYYHFHREYKEDSWSRARRAFLDLVDRFEGYPDEFEDMTPGQADRVLSAFLETLRTQRLILAELAFDDAVPDDSAGVWDSLWVRLEELRDEQAEDRLMASDDDEAGREFMLRLQQLEETVIRETFAGEPTIDFGAVDTMIDRLRWYRKRADPEFSEDLEIEVQLPGTIIVTNAPDIVGGMVTWDLDLSVLGTAEIELLATSFVPK